VTRRFDRSVKAKLMSPWDPKRALRHATLGYVVTFTGRIEGPLKAVMYRGDVVVEKAGKVHLFAYGKWATTEAAARRIAIRVLRRAIRDREYLIANITRTNVIDRRALAKLEAKP
jgi:hypothetical protein